MRARTCAFLLASLLISSAGLPAGTEILRTFVSASAGSDSNPCTRLAPCRNFAAAMANTLPGGEIVVLDSGGYGPTVVNKNVSIIAPAGVYCAIAPTSGTAIVVASGDTSKVRLQGLNLISMGADTGISVTNAIGVDIESCVIREFDSGINVNSVPTGVDVAIRNTTVSGRGQGSGTTGIVAVSNDMLIENSHVSRNTYGVAGSNGAAVLIRDSSLSFNSTGVAAFASPVGAEVHVDRCIISHGTNGVMAGDFLAPSDLDSYIVVTDSVFTFLTGTGITVADGATGTVSGSKFHSEGTFNSMACPWYILAGSSLRSGGDNIIEPHDVGACHTATSVYGRK